jgi:hypothetical protein
MNPRAGEIAKAKERALTRPAWGLPARRDCRARAKQANEALAGQNVGRRGERCAQGTPMAGEPATGRPEKE